MGQLALTYTPEHEGKTAWDAQLEILRAAVAHLVAKEVADQLNINRSTLSEALNPPPRHRRDADDEGRPQLRRWAAEWTHIVKAMLAARRTDEVALDLLRRLCEADCAVTPFTVADNEEFSAEEIAAAQRVIDSVNKRKSKRAA